MTERNDFYVYAISVDGVVRYIGKGRGKRIRMHMAYVRYAMSKPHSERNYRMTKFQWRLFDAVRAGSSVEEIFLAEDLKEREALEREIAEIAACPDGQLLNVLKGGDGPLSEIMQAAMAGEEMSRKISEGTRKGLTPEILAARRESQIRAARRPENRARQAALLKSDRVRQRLREVMKSPEVRKKLSDAAKNRPVQADFCERMLHGMKEKYGTDRRREVARANPQSQESVERHKERQRLLWQDPEYRERIMRVRREAKARKEQAHV